MSLPVTYPAEHCAELPPGRPLGHHTCMKKVAVAVASNRPIPAPTQQALAELRSAGASYHSVEGSSDVAFARNVMLSLLVHQMRADPSREVALLVDDDMVFNVAQARELCAHAIAKQCAASAAYPTAVAEIAANSRLCPVPGKWLTGLGFFAIPRAALFALADASPAFDWRPGINLWEFTTSSLHELCHLGAPEMYWIGEDYWLCIRLGGVDLLPISVGHLKMVPLECDEHTLQRIAAGQPLEQRGPGERAPFRVTTGEGSGLAVQQPERQANGQGDIK